jgi:S-DNA-T family DNA segregation ATPase FtsK/SpoIIIE
VLIIDELAVFTKATKKKDADEFSGLLRDLVARGRAAGIILVCATQRPSADIVPTSLRDLISIRIALRSTTPDASDTLARRVRPTRT